MNQRVARTESCDKSDSVTSTKSTDCKGYISSRSTRFEDIQDSEVLQCSVTVRVMRNFQQ